MVKVWEAKKRKKNENREKFTNVAEIEWEYAICIIGLWRMDALHRSDQ